MAAPQAVVSIDFYIFPYECLVLFGQERLSVLSENPFKAHRVLTIV